MKLSANKKKFIVLTTMVLLLVVAGTLNFVLNDKINDGGGSVQTTFFAQHRTLRESSRLEQLALLDAVIGSEMSTAQAIANAETEKLALCKMMETELTLERLIKAKGFEDVIITMSTENCNVIVHKDGMTKADADVIYNIITRETGLISTNVRVSPVTTENL